MRRALLATLMTLWVVGATCTRGSDCCTDSCNPTTRRCESIIIR